MSNFKNIITEINSHEKILPIFHTTDVYSFRSILMSRKIELKLCHVFKEKLIYTFYGKPSYRKDLKSSTHNISKFPVCFILKSIGIPNPRFIFPFDSGLFCTDDIFKHKYFHPKMKIQDFEIESDYNVLVRFVQSVFENNYSYLVSNTKYKKYPSSELECIAYNNLINAKEDDYYDDRISTIEISFDNLINLNNSNILNIICPSSFLDDKVIREIIENEFQIKEVMTYFSYRCNPLEIYGVIREKSLNYIINKYL